MKRLNDSDRRQWVENNEGLYLWFRSSRLDLYTFVRKNRMELDRLIFNILNPALGGYRR